MRTIMKTHVRKMHFNLKPNDGFGLNCNGK